MTLTTHGATRTSFGPSAPASVPATSTITGVSYDISYTRPGLAPGSLNSQICATGYGCVAANYPGGSTTTFNGIPATTWVYMKFTWLSNSPYLYGTIKGGVDVTDTITVNYS